MYFAYRRWLISVAILLALALPLLAQIQKGETLVKATLIADTAAVVPGKDFQVGLLLEMAPDWHTYWEYSGDAVPNLDPEQRRNFVFFIKEALHNISHHARAKHVGHIRRIVVTVNQCRTCGTPTGYEVNSMGGSSAPRALLKSRCFSVLQTTGATHSPPASGRGILYTTTSRLARLRHSCFR